MTADQIVSLLRVTGTPQPESDTTEIGPLPNIEAAIAVARRHPAVGRRSTLRSTAPYCEFNSAASAGFSCDGGGSPIVSCLARDQGPNGETTIVNGDQLPTDQPGTHTLTATVTNQLGLTDTATATYEVGPGCFAPGSCSLQPSRAATGSGCWGLPILPGPAQRVKVLRNGKQAGSSRDRR